MDATRLYFLIFGALTIVGGVIGYVKAGSVPSIIAGAITGILLLIAGYILPEHRAAGLVTAFVVSLLLAGQFVPKLIRTGKVAKGDPLQTARLAGIMAAKQAASLIPLCHPLQLTHVSVELTPTRRGYRIDARVRTEGKTGVEMEALTAVSVAALTIYDMVKAVDKDMVIGDICLVEKSGGRTGHYRRSSSR